MIWKYEYEQARFHIISYIYNTIVSKQRIMTYIGNLSAMTFFTQKRRIEYGKNYIEMTFSTENKTLLSIGTRNYELNSNFLAYHFDKNTQNLKDGDLIHSHVSSNDIIMKCTFVNFQNWIKIRDCWIGVNIV